MGAVLLVALGACGGGGGGSGGGGTPVPVPKDTTGCVPATRPATPTLGLAAHPPFDEGFWQAIDDLGVKWLRVDLYWRDIEPTPGQRDWAGYEDFLGKARQRGVQVLFIVNHPPAWASAEPARFAAHVASFSREAAQWAQGRVAAWEAFNEPNLPGFGWPFSKLSAGEDASLYVDAVAAVNRGLRAAGDPAPVVAGALSPHGHEPRAFIDAVFSRLPAACHDAVSIHPYGGKGQLPNLREAVRQQVAALQGRAPQVWITEYGTSDPAQQEALLADAMGPGTAPPPEPLFWFTLRDLGFTEPYGLIDFQNRRRPVYKSFQDAVRRQGG